MSHGGFTVGGGTLTHPISKSAHAFVWRGVVDERGGVVSRPQPTTAPSPSAQPQNINRQPRLSKRLRSCGGGAILRCLRWRSGWRVAQDESRVGDRQSRPLLGYVYCAFDDRQRI